VKFLNGRKKRIRREKFDTKLYGVGCTIREQIPLKLAWALTIAKAQGASLDAVVVDTANTFECGQVYVGLSRASNEHGLCIRNLDAESQIRADPLAAAFHQSFTQTEPTYETSCAGASYGSTRFCAQRRRGPSCSWPTLSFDVGQIAFRYFHRAKRFRGTFRNAAKVRVA